MRRKPSKAPKRCPRCSAERRIVTSSRVVYLCSTAFDLCERRLVWTVDELCAAAAAREAA